jgi:predicted anti-sigma-YlaC factor YlaD
MLRCRDIADLSSDYVNGDLTWSRRFAVRLHLTICRFCRRYVRQMRETVRLLRGLRGETETAYEELARTLFRSTRRM